MLRPSPPLLVAAFGVRSAKLNIESFALSMIAIPRATLVGGRLAALARTVSSTIANIATVRIADPPCSMDAFGDFLK